MVPFDSKYFFLFWFPRKFIVPIYLFLILSIVVTLVRDRDSQKFLILDFLYQFIDYFCSSCLDINIFFFIILCIFLWKKFFFFLEMFLFFLFFMYIFFFFVFSLKENGDNSPSLYILLFINIFSLWLVCLIYNILFFLI